jgi:hypothetical protein
MMDKAAHPKLVGIDPFTHKPISTHFLENGSLYIERSPPIFYFPFGGNVKLQGIAGLQFRKPAFRPIGNTNLDRAVFADRNQVNVAHDIPIAAM